MKHLLSIILLLVPIFIFSQNIISVYGSILNKNKIPIQDAIIHIKQFNLEVNTNSKGHFFIEQIKSGNYNFIIYAEGYKTITKNIELKANNKNNEMIFSETMQKIAFESKIIEIHKNTNNDFGLKPLPLSDGTSIYAGKNASLIQLDYNAGNKSTNNAREMFAKLPGINIWESDGGGIQIGIGTRGLSPNRTANFNTRQNGYDISADALGYPESYYTPPFEALEGIEVIKGAASLQYGTQFGGLINFRIKKPKDKKIHFTTRNTYGTYNFFNTFNHLSGKVKRFYYQAYYQYKRGDGWRDNSGFSQHQAFVQLGYHFNEKMNLKIEYTHMCYNAQQPGGLTDQQFKEKPQSSHRERNWFRVRWNLLAINYDLKIGNRGFFNVRAFGMLATRDALGFLGKINWIDTKTNRELIHGSFKNLGIEARYLQRYKIKKHNGAFLVGSRLYSGQTITKQGNAPNGYGKDFYFINNNNVEQSNFEFPSKNFSLFIENIFFIAKSLTITPGIRYDFITSSSKGFYKEYIIHQNGDTLLTNEIKDSRNTKRNIFLGGLGLSYKPLNSKKSLEIYANLSQNYRAINFNDIRINNPNILIDPNIEDEFGFTAELGIRGRLKSYFIYNLSSFYIFYGNKIGLAPKGLKRIRTNLGNARNIGLELFAEFDFLRLIKGDSSKFNLSVYSNFSYINAKYITSKEPAYVGNFVEFVPHYTFRAGIRFGNKKFNLNIKASYVSSQFTDATNAVTPSSDATIGEIPAYYVLDFSSSYTFKKWFKLELGVTNFTNNIYFTRRATAYPGPGVMPSEGIGGYLTLQFSIGSKR